MNDLRAAPNQLTFLRLCMVPFLVLAILDGHFRTAAVLFFVAGVTDGLDGLLARLLHQQTVLGQYLDPVADKLLLSTVFLVLNHEGLISRRVTVLVFGRDLGILVVSAILYVSIGMRDFRPSLYGKANTLAQIVALVTVLISQFFAPGYLLAVRNASLETTMALTIISGFHYAWRVGMKLSVSDDVPGGKSK
ncbi:CDP-diacylglycerol--glycerol-3-phosphate 3-phosphatidyltransferase [Acidisarcina polymorpha]|uniref:CDP-diacylglycerol--glycerol-3-phosphate 3-phosphatidyltransferase n=1 Tax=Acidisarcina polymorpha TaxID=2211140 RepID=A0A2Z5G998_9BACT|nr:CDP-alcohol phosphatidyltransferase family protein [Acidisarcina polymorpha]AXC15387.1 CDP-diacylglycerol--glycerol-3-phosphate 3-phosphatidyltransferase [Acidisarcina polymorpha]